MKILADVESATLGEVVTFGSLLLKITASFSTIAKEPGSSCRIWYTVEMHVERRRRGRHGRDTA
ncbi:hypothetical protein [Paenibacillus illinoisensis]|uniref:hypothetical protein n=1 Tax=Paenibacillus illinoisensis TaxID=59845 RepID=UPI0030176D97